MKSGRQDGFTLIELMITVAIVGILASIAYPGYQKYMLSARRADAQADLLKIQLGLEKWRANHNTYSSNLADAGFSDNNPYYGYSITVGSATATSASAYTVTATATGAQANDSGCTSLAINQSGNKTPASGCWTK